MVWGLRSGSSEAWNTNRSSAACSLLVAIQISPSSSDLTCLDPGAFLDMSSEFCGTESRINRTIPRIAGLQLPEIPQREAKNEVELQQSSQNRHPNRILSMLKPTLESHDSNRTILNRPILDSESPIQLLRVFWLSPVSIWPLPVADISLFSEPTFFGHTQVWPTS